MSASLFVQYFPVQVANADTRWGIQWMLWVQYDPKVSAQPVMKTDSRPLVPWYFDTLREAAQWVETQAPSATLVFTHAGRAMSGIVVTHGG